MSKREIERRWELGWRLIAKSKEWLGVGADDVCSVCNRWFGGIDCGPFSSFIIIPVC